MIAVLEPRALAYETEMIPQRHRYTGNREDISTDPYSCFSDLAISLNSLRKNSNASLCDVCADIYAKFACFPKNVTEHKVKQKKKINKNSKRRQKIWKLTKKQKKQNNVGQENKTNYLIQQL